MASGMENLITDEVIKRRLLIDGDGAGDDRKLIALTKSFANWCMANESEVDCKLSFRRLVGQVHQAEYAAKRTHKSITVNERVQASYSQLKAQVQEEIELTKKEIAESKRLLEEATKLRKYSMEYDSLAKLINDKPDRKETDAKRLQLDEDLKALWENRELLEERMDDRRRSIAVMVGSLKKMRQILKEDDVMSEDSENLSSSAAVEAPTAIEVDEVPAQNEVDSTCSPVEQMCVDPPTGVAVDNKNISGTITSVPVSPVGKPNPEKYEDLSESETDD